MARQGSGFTEALRDITLSRYQQGPPAPERCRDTKMASFRVKLVLYFLLLSLLPVAAAFWGFSTVAAHGETKRVDERLQAGLRASLAGYQQRIDSAQATATSLAAANWFKRDLEENDDAAVRRALTRYPNVEITGPFGLDVGGPTDLIPPTIERLLDELPR